MSWGMPRKKQCLFLILFVILHFFNDHMLRWTNTCLDVDDTGLSRVTTDENLYNAFASFGRLREAKVIVDRASGRSKGFGFVTYETVDEAEKAREGMNAKFLDGWVIFVDPARPREAQPRQPPRQDMQFNSQSTDMGFTTNKTIGWCG